MKKVTVLFMLCSMSSIVLPNFGGKSTLAPQKITGLGKMSHLKGTLIGNHAGFKVENEQKKEEYIFYKDVVALPKEKFAKNETHYFYGVRDNQVDKAKTEASITIYSLDGTQKGFYSKSSKKAQIGGILYQNVVEYSGKTRGPSKPFQLFATYFKNGIKTTLWGIKAETEPDHLFGTQASTFAQQAIYQQGKIVGHLAGSHAQIGNQLYKKVQVVPMTENIAIGTFLGTLKNKNRVYGIK